MKLRKGFLSGLIITLGIVFMSLMFSPRVDAATADETLYLGLEQYRTSGYSYQVIKKIMWKISSYADENGANPNKDRTIYCIKAGPGFGSGDMGESYVGAVTIRPYTQKFDFKNRDSITGNYLNAIPSGEKYNSLVWLLEHCYVPSLDENKEYRNILLTNAEIPDSELSDDEIDVVQQLAIWYFTNTDAYKISEKTFELYVKEKSDAAYMAIEDKFKDSGWDRQEDAIKLFNYLVDQAEANKNMQVVPNNTTNPIKLTATDAKIVTEGENYIIGPYTLSNESAIDYTLTATLKNGTADVPFKILDTNKAETTIENVKGQNFYISVAKDAYASGLELTVNAKTIQNAIIYWSVANGPETDQPVVELTKEEKNYPEKVITPNIPEEKLFDLALRKFITGVNNKELVDGNGKYIKEPVVDVTPLVNKTGWTAIYKHQKAPVGVSVGDEVIYTIRVYNEGEVDGYVTEITDHLPPQLEFVNDEFNASYGWSVSADGRTVKTDITSPNTKHSASRDSIYENRTETEDKVLLKAFNGQSLDYIDVKIKCKVSEVKDLDTIITNIADITGFTDSNGKTVKDRDSEASNIVLPSDENLPDYKGKDTNKSILTDSNYYYEGQEDDDDFDKLILQEFDLALRKFITGVNDTKVTNRYPVFTKNKDENGNYIYNHTKEPVLVETTDLVEYTIRIFNEGNIAGYAKQIVDDIPSGLEFIPDDETNKEYRWVMYRQIKENEEVTSENKLVYGGKTYVKTTNAKEAEIIATDYLSKEQENETGRNNLLEGFNMETMAAPNHKDVKVVFKVVAPSSYEGIITNTAEISDDSDENGNKVEDRDSTPGNENEKEDDIDKEHIKLKYFDLALRKFITGVNDTEVTNRYPVFSIDENGNYVYTHTKEPVDVENGKIVTYTLRLYNEGTMAGYAKEVIDDIPDGLVFLPENETNKEYRWVMYRLVKEDEKIDEKDITTFDGKKYTKTENASEAKMIWTDYLSKAQEDATNRNNLLKAFDRDTMKEPDHRDIKIAFKVTEPNTSDRILINYAQIADDEDENGKDVVDKDSTPNKWIDKEDDQDIEKVKVKYFDLALRKWVTEAIVIENGKETVTPTGHHAEDDPEEVVKVEIAKSKINKVVVKFRYSIRVTNEGEIPGYATEISDYIPAGLKFVQSDNPQWKEVEGKIVTNALADTLLQPGESAEVEVLLTWINGGDNMGLKVNVAEISEDKNDSDTPDIDSTPNNRKEGEDDIDDAPVILATKTGETINTEYIGIVAGSLIILSAGVILIKKYVL